MDCNIKRCYIGDLRSSGLKVIDRSGIEVPVGSQKRAGANADFATPVLFSVDLLLPLGPGRETVYKNFVINFGNIVVEVKAMSK